LTTALEVNGIHSESAMAEELLKMACERLKQQTLADPSKNAKDDTIAQIEENTRLFEEGLGRLSQPKMVHQATFVQDVSEIASCSDCPGVSKETKINRVHENHGLIDNKKAMIIRERPGKVRALDCDRLQNMNLAFWEEKRLGQRSTEAALDLKSVERLEYLSLMHLDLAYLQQQRLVRLTQQSFPKTDMVKGVLNNQLPCCQH